MKPQLMLAHPQRMHRSLAIAAFLLFASPVAAQLPHESASPAPAVATPKLVDSQQAIAQLDPENTLLLDLSTGGRVTIRMRPDIAPKHVARVKELTRRGFYDGVLFHRVIEGFMAQTGDPKGTGQGGSDLPDLEGEFNENPHVRGAVSMARTEEKNSANSQFFIMFTPLLRLDRQYTVFGRVVDGMQWVDKIERGEPPTNPSRVVQASIMADNKPPPPMSAQPGNNVAAAEAAKLLQGATPPRP